MSDTVGRLRENADLEEDCYPARTINVPAGHAAYIYPVDPASAHHQVNDMLENGEDG